MLVLSRKPGETVQIGPDVFVKVVQIRGGSVRLAFAAPPEVFIRRSELEPRAAETDSMASRTCRQKAVRPLVA